MLLTWRQWFAFRDAPYTQMVATLKAMAPISTPRVIYAQPDPKVRMVRNGWRKDYEAWTRRHSA